MNVTVSLEIGIISIAGRIYAIGAIICINILRRIKCAFIAIQVKKSAIANVNNLGLIIQVANVADVIILWMSSKCPGKSLF